MKPLVCKTCGKETDSYIYKTCEACRGVRTAEELSKLSLVEQIKLWWELRKIEEKASQELSNLRDQCQHLELSRKHLHYDRWEGAVVDDNLHLNDENSFVWCTLCGKSFGWECLKNPKGYCEYPSNLKEEVEHGCNAVHCVHCKKPKDRWRHYTEAVLGFPPPPTYSPSDEEVDGYMQKIISKTKKVPITEPPNGDYTGYNTK